MPKEVTSPFEDITQRRTDDAELVAEILGDEQAVDMQTLIGNKGEVKESSPKDIQISEGEQVVEQEVAEHDRILFKLKSFCDRLDELREKYRQRKGDHDVIWKEIREIEKEMREYIDDKFDNNLFIWATEFIPVVGDDELSDELEILILTLDVKLREQVGGLLDCWEFFTTHPSGIQSISDSNRNFTKDIPEESHVFIHRINNTSSYEQAARVFIEDDNYFKSYYKE